MTRKRKTQPATRQTSAADDELLRQLLLSDTEHTAAAADPAIPASEPSTVPAGTTARSVSRPAAPTHPVDSPAPVPGQAASTRMNGRGAGPPPPPVVGDDGDSDEASLTLIDHLRELRSRLVRASLGVLAGMLVGLFLVLGPLRLVDSIIAAFVPTDNPYPPVQAVGTTEAFTSYMTVAMTVGVILGMPVIVYQLMAFIVPGLTHREKWSIFKAMPFVIGFFGLGIAFGWFVTVPTAIQFLIGFSDSTLIQVQPTLSDFIRTVTLLLVINGIIFEMPIIISVLAMIGVVTAQQLRSYRRYAFVIVFVVAAIITPTGDPVNLALLALPMYLLFELGILLAGFVPAQRRKTM